MTEISGKSNPTEAFRQFYRILWGYYIGSIEETSKPPRLIKKNLSQMKLYIGAVEQLYELVDFGKKYSIFIHKEISTESPDFDQIKSFSAKLSEIDNLQVMIKSNFPILNPIIDFFTIKKSFLYGESIKEIAESSVIVYEEYSNLLSALYELIIQTIQYNEPNFKENNLQGSQG